MEIYVLKNKLEMRLNGELPINISRGQVRQLLSILAIETDRVISPDRLTELIWDPEEDRDLAGSLKQVVYNARQVLPTDLLVTEADGYRLLCSAEDYLDLKKFRELGHLARAQRDSDPPGAAAAYQNGLALWGTRPLGDLPVTPTMIPIRQELLTELSNVREEFFEISLLLGRYREMIAPAHSWLAEDPFNEHLRHLLMLALHQAGRRAEALKVYEEAQHLLTKTIGRQVEPGPTLQLTRALVEDQEPHSVWKLYTNSSSIVVPSIHIRKLLSGKSRNGRPQLLGDRAEIGGSDPASSRIDSKRPHSARIWNYWLGGKDNYAIDRDVGEAFLDIYPHQADIARFSRAFLGRAVRFLVTECEIRQFLDIGTGLPTANNTHEVAQRIAPDCRIVYVDNDPLVLVHARALLTSTPQGACAYLDSDIREPNRIITEAARTLDFTRPIGLLMLGILGHLADEEDPGEVAGRLIAALPPGSYAVINDGTDVLHELDNRNDGSTESARARAINRYIEAGGTPYHLRTPGQLMGFLQNAGLEFVEPGLVPTSQWRLETTASDPPPQVDNYCGVARKP